MQNVQLTCTSFMCNHADVQLSCTTQIVSASANIEKVDKIDEFFNDAASQHLYSLRHVTY